MSCASSRNFGILLAYASSVVNMICGLFLSVFLLRVLGDTEYGIYQTAMSFSGLLIVLEFGTGTVMARNISLCRDSNNKALIDANVATIWVVANCLVLLIIAASAVLFFTVDSIYSNSLASSQILQVKAIFILATVQLVMSFYVSTLNGVALGFERYAYSSKVNIIRALSRTLLISAVVMAWDKAIAIAAVDVLVNTFLAIVSYGVCRKGIGVRFSPRLFDSNLFKLSLPLCLALFLQSIINQINGNADKVLIGAMMSPEAVALYSISLYVFGVFSSLSATPIGMYIPRIAKAIGIGAAPASLMSEYISAARLVSFVGGNILFGFAAFGRQFIAIVYGVQYVDAWIFATILMAAMYPNVITGVLVNVLDALNKRMVRSLLLTASAIANVILTVIFIGFWGMAGAAAATALCALITQGLIMGLYYHKVIKVDVLALYKESLVGTLPFQIVAFALVFAIGPLMGVSVFSLLICAVVYCLISVGGTFLFGKGIRDDVRSIMRKRRSH